MIEGSVTRMPVAWWTALAIAAAVGMVAGSVSLGSIGTHVNLTATSWAVKLREIRAVLHGEGPGAAR